MSSINYTQAADFHYKYAKDLAFVKIWWKQHYDLCAKDKNIFPCTVNISGENNCLLHKTTATLNIYRNK